MSNKESTNWKSIIWREILRCQDPDYAEHLRLVVSGARFSWMTRLANSWQARPLAAELERALHQMSQAEWSGGDIWKLRLRRLDRTKSENISFESLLAELENYHWLRRFIARHVLLYRGGEVVDQLKKAYKDGTSNQPQIIAWLLKSISRETIDRLGQEPIRWICLQCFSHCQFHRAELDAGLIYYGCRICKRSWGLIYVSNGIVAILDTKWREPYKLTEDGTLRVNWSMYQKMFDFDSVEIINSNDEEGERFAVQVGNDTDLLRKQKYTQMHCHYTSDCNLSANTIRVLTQMFGTVKENNKV